ncbi:MAG: hypothetical protein ACLU8F_01195 [Clostridia bacterium]
MEIEKQLMKDTIKKSIQKHKLYKDKKIDLDEEIEKYVNERYPKRFEYVNKSLAALEMIVKLNKKIPPDDIWNKVAEENGFLSNISIEYIEDKNWRDVR